MQSNPFVKNPLYVAQLNPINGKIMKAFYFMGLVPDKVREAAKNIHMKSNAESLKNFFGNNWKNILTPVDPHIPEPFGLATYVNKLTFFSGYNAVKYGGDLGSFEEFNISDINQEEKDDRNVLKNVTINEKDNRGDVHMTISGSPIYTNIAIYPEDTIFDVKNKIALATGIPFYRQHLFYYVNDEGPVYPYKIFADGLPSIVDWRELVSKGREILTSPSDTISKSSISLSGLPIDTKLEEKKDSIRIEAYDTFTKMSPNSGIVVNKLYFIDLFTVLSRDNIGSIIKDAYKFDLLYYGGIIRFWPHLNQNALILAITSHDKIRLEYPILNPDNKNMQSKIETEKNAIKIISDWKDKLNDKTRSNIAITSLNVRAIPDVIKMRVNIRNVFDWIPTSHSILAMFARFDFDSSYFDPKIISRGGQSTVIASKKHISTYQPSIKKIIDWYENKILKRNSISLVLSKKQDSIIKDINYVWLTIHYDGKYEAVSNWHENNRLGFDDVTNETIQIVLPVIQLINEMGAAAFPIGGKLSTPNKNKNNINLGMMNVSIFWPHTVTSEGFKEIKQSFKLFEKADIISSKNLQQGNSYNIHFKKGVTAYDPRTADRITSQLKRVGLINQYSWMFDNNITSRWNISFAGRLIKIYHRATDIKIEIIGADNMSEFEIIRKYILALLDHTASKLDLSFSKYTATSKKLQKLQERDPELFDLKKFGKNTAVYSVLCQSVRQPHVYNQEEVKSLNNKQQSRLIKYWNFTDNVPAYYDCPDPRVPYLSLRSKAHPLGYCLPCCKKTKPTIGSKADLTHKHCLQQWTHGKQDNTIDKISDDSSSRHILSYGKFVSVGRLSDSPREINNGLFANMLPFPYEVKLVGVKQSVPAISNAGFAFSLAYLIGIGDSTAEDVLYDLAKLARSMTNSYHSLGDGAGKIFSSSNELADEIIDVFIKQYNKFSLFGHGNIGEDIWPSILIDLSRHAFNVESLIFTDNGYGDIKLHISSSSIQSILGRDICKNRKPPKIVMMLVNEIGTFPLIIVNPKLFIKTPANNRWMIVRKIFDLNGEDDNSNFKDHVGEIITRLIEYSINLTTNQITSMNQYHLPDLYILTLFLCKNQEYVLHVKLINLRNMCYGVIIQHKDDVNKPVYIYFPIVYSPYSIDTSPVSFSVRPDGSYPKNLLNKFIDEFNEFIKEHTEYMKLSVDCLLKYNEKSIGFVISKVHNGKNDVLYYYHDEEQFPLDMQNKKFITIPYNPSDIDKQILSFSKQPLDIKEKTDESIKYNINGKLYKLFLLEFSSCLKNDRNNLFRESLIDAIKSTRFDSMESISVLKRHLYNLLKEYPDDIPVVRDIIARAYITSPYDPGESIINTINISAFEFDKTILSQLKNMNHDDIIIHLKKIMGSRIKIIDDDDKNIEMQIDNIYTPCDEVTNLKQIQCDNQKLKIPKSIINDFYDLLAADITNPYKYMILSSSPGVFNIFNFIRRPDEHIYIKI